MPGAKKVLLPLVTSSSFACVVLSEGHAKFKRKVSLGNGVVVIPRLSLKPDSSWVEQLGTVFGNRVAKSDCVLSASEAGVTRATLQRRAELAYWATVINCRPTGSHAHLLAGEDVNGRVDIRLVTLLPRYTYANGNMPRPWTPPLLKASAPVLRGILQIDNDDNASRRLRRGLNVLLSTLSATVLQDRLHGHVRALTALLDLPRNKGTAGFADRMQTLCVCSPAHDYDTFYNLYDLRSKIEHMLDPKEASPSLSDTLFKEHIESQTRLAERAALGVYQRVLSDQSLLAIFSDATQLKSFWNLPPTTRRSKWGKAIHVDGRVR